MKKLKFFPIYLISYIPFWGLYALSDIASFVLYYIVRYRRAVVQDNLQRSFPKKSESDIRGIAKAYYKHFCDVMVETIKVLNIQESNIDQRLVLKNVEVIHSLHEAEKNIILYTSHIGNWEWFALLQPLLPYRGVAIYEKVSSGYVNELMLQIRGRFKTLCVESAKSYRQVISKSRDGVPTLFLLIGDQGPRYSSAAHFDDFLNQDTAFLVGAEKMASKTNNAVVYPHVRKLQRGQYEIEFKIITSEAKQTETNEITRSFIQLLEENIQESPHMWLWSHRRWKRKKEHFKSLQ